MRTIPRSGWVINSYNQAGIFTTNTAGSLNIFRIGLWLSSNYHSPQSPNINANWNHIGSKKEIKYFSVFTIMIFTFQTLLKDRSNFWIVHTTCQFYHKVIFLIRIYFRYHWIKCYSIKFCFSKIGETTLHVIQNANTGSAQFTQTVEIASNSPEIINDLIGEVKCFKYFWRIKKCRIHTNQCGCRCRTNSHYTAIEPCRFIFRFGFHCKIRVLNTNTLRRKLGIILTIQFQKLPACVANSRSRSNYFGSRTTFIFAKFADSRFIDSGHSP